MEESIKGFLMESEHISKKLKDYVETGDPIRVISHLDADGLAAAGLLGSALARLNGVFHISILKQLRPEDVKNLTNEKYKVYIFTDMGSGQLDAINSYMKNKTVFIFDHHQPKIIEEVENPELIHLNPHFFGIDGAVQVSGAGVTYSVVRNFGDTFKELSTLAIVGAVGDLQDRGEYRDFLGFNKEVILKDALDAGVLSVDKDIRLFGRETRPIHIAIQYTTDPFIPGLSGNEAGCISFISQLGIPLKNGEQWRTLSDLTTDEKIKLNSALVAHMLQNGATVEDAKSIIGYVYTLIKEEKGTPLRDAREYAALLNACGRMRFPGIGISLCLGDRGNALKEAQTLMTNYRQKLSAYLNWLIEGERVRETEVLQYFHGENVIDERMVGTVTSIASFSKILNPNKPIISFAYSEDGTVKVSARANDELIKKGVNLGKALADAVKGMNLDATNAGGHNIAAGASIPAGMEEKLIYHLEKIIKKQLDGGDGNESNGSN
ncbi:MAG: DHHA1 domain-containing protein [Candidatus Odinarchaeia archaeon]